MGSGRTVLLADDHAVVRDAFRADLEHLGFTVCAEAGDAEGAVEGTCRHRPELCLLDVRMPGGGISAARTIAARVPETKVVMLTVSIDPDDVRAARGAGAVGYILKDVETGALASALDAILRGEIVLPEGSALRDLNA